MSKRRLRLIAMMALLLSSALLLSACGLFGEDAPDVSALPSPRPTPSTTPTAPPSDVPSAAPSEEPALISGLEEASALVCEVKNSRRAATSTRPSTMPWPRTRATSCRPPSCFGTPAS